MQILQAWKEHRRLQTALPLPRPAFNKRFFAAALARIKNAASGLYAACEVQHASRLVNVVTNKALISLAQAAYWWMAANPALSKTSAHARNVYMLYFFWLLGLLLQLLQRICVDEAPIDSLRSLYVFPCLHITSLLQRVLRD